MIFTESTIEQAAIDWLKDVCTMIRMIFRWTMIELGRNQSVHFIRGIIVPDDAPLPKLMRGEVRVKDVEKEVNINSS